MDETATGVISPQDRVIRVFISSTFRDMQAERDYLVKFIFPQLRKLCESRGVTWGEVDLRWGVTDEQVAEGKVLPICLEEIKRCRPYFIGLLGERYGWIPDAIPADLLEREPWLEEHLHGKTSVTELEILHGVLRNPKMAGHAYFYFRDPNYVSTIPEKDRKKFIAENTSDADKLRNLKETIRRSSFPVRENYPDPKAMGELVLADLTKVINDLFPEGSQPDPLDREAMDHEAYAQSRERVYIGRQEYFDRLDTHAAANNTQPLVILGESGSGKSALLANWVARFGLAHPDALVLQHYIGATPYSADWTAMLRRLMGEFKRQLGIQQDIPAQPDALRSAFPNWLYMAAAKGRVVLVLDALNQLEDRDGAPDLVWLPPVLPENVQLIVSTLPGRSLDEIHKRNWPTLKVELLSTNERRKLIAEYLAQHAKSLNAARVERIAAAQPSANPLYLRVLLNELRLVRTHEELEERIGDYLKAESPYALYEKVIARWEQDYESDSTLVGDTLSLLWAARHGLAETELLQALGKDGEPLQRAKWSPLLLAMSDALVSRSGLLTFAHDFLRSATRDTYVPTKQDQGRAHMRLANYFASKDPTDRVADEYPWQLGDAGEWLRLYAVMANVNFFTLPWAKHRNEVLHSWVDIEFNTECTAAQAATQMLRELRGAGQDAVVANLGRLVHDLGHRKEALAIWEPLIEKIASGSQIATGISDDILLQALADKASECRRLGDNGMALSLLQSFEKLHRGLWRMGMFGDVYHGIHFASALGETAMVLRAMGRLDEALAKLQEAEAIFRDANCSTRLAVCLGNQGNVFLDKGNFESALKLYHEEERIYRGNQDMKGLGRNLNNQGVALVSMGQQEQAYRCYCEADRLLGHVGDSATLAQTLFNLARLLWAQKKTNEAMEHVTRAENLYQGAEDAPGLQCLLDLKGGLCYELGQYDQALVASVEAERLAHLLNNMQALQLSIGNQALIQIRRGLWEQGMERFLEQERICRETGNLRWLGWGLGNKANEQQRNGLLEDALRTYQSQARVWEEAKEVDALARNLDARASILVNLKSFAEADLILVEMATLYRRIRHNRGIAHALNKRAILWAMHLNRVQEALPLVEEALSQIRNEHDSAQIKGLEETKNFIQWQMEKARGG